MPRAIFMCTINNHSCVLSTIIRVYCQQSFVWTVNNPTVCLYVVSLNLSQLFPVATSSEVDLMYVIL